MELSFLLLSTLGTAFRNLRSVNSLEESSSFYFRAAEDKSVNNHLSAEQDLLSTIQPIFGKRGIESSRLNPDREEIANKNERESDLLTWMTLRRVRERGSS